jgi:hypothetical protein
LLPFIFICFFIYWRGSVRGFYLVSLYAPVVVVWELRWLVEFVHSSGGGTAVRRVYFWMEKVLFCLSSFVSSSFSPGGIHLVFVSWLPFAASCVGSVGASIASLRVLFIFLLLFHFIAR